MRLLSLICLPVAALTIAAGWADEDRGPGLPGERQGDMMVFRAADFTGVALGAAASVDVRVGSAWSVRATGPNAAFAKLRVVTERGQLKIEMRGRYGQREDRALMQQVHFTITAPRLSQVALGGSGRINVDRVEGGDFAVSLGGSGDVALGRLAVASTTVSIGGSGGVSAAGTTGQLTVNLGGSGRFDAPRLRAGSAKISSAGSGSVRAAVDGDARVSTVGSGDIDLGANARCQVSRQGSGRVHCGG